MMKRTFFTSIVLGLALILSSCGFDDEEQYTIYKEVGVVVNEPSIGGLGISTINHVVAAPELRNQGVEEGDCIYVQYKINYDNQPAKDYYTATEIVVEHVYIKKSIKLTSENINLYDTEPLSSLSDNFTPAWNSYNCIARSAMLRGNIFLYIQHLASIESVCNYDLYYNPVANEDDSFDFYLTAKENTSDEKPKKERTLPFDINSLIETHGKDTVVLLNETEQGYKFIKYNLLYPKYTANSTGEINYVRVNSTPFVVSAIK